MILHYISTKEDKIFAAIGGCWGYICSLFMLDIAPLSWQYLLSGFLSLIWIAIGAIASVAAKEFYNWGKPKVIIMVKVIYINIKTKINGRKNNKRAA